MNASPPRVDPRQANWDRLAELLEVVERRGLRELSPRELREFSRLYRQASSDLSLARSRHRDELAFYLNQLVARAHAQVYARPARRRPDIPGFFWTTVPDTFRACLPYWLCSLAILVVFSSAGYVTTAANPAWAEVLVSPGMRGVIEDFVKQDAEPGKYFADTAGMLGGGGFSSMLMVNNIQVALMCFAFGISAGVGTCYVLARNALMLGSALGIGAFHGKLALFSAVIAPHGFVEISAVVVAGAAGLRLGYALINPGDLTRREALQVAGVQSGQLILGTVPMFIFAGLVEGLLSPVTQGPMGTIELRLLFGVLSGIVLHVWLLMGGTRERAAGAAPAS